MRCFSGTKVGIGKPLAIVVKGVVYLPTQKDFYTSGKSYDSMFGNVDLKFSMLCLKIEFI